MFNGAHVIILSTDAEADRAFFRDVLEFPHVDAGDGWLLFALPPAETAFHPGEVNDVHSLYLMCEDVEATKTELENKGVACTAIEDHGWGIVSQLTLPGGGKVGFYQPRHPTAF